MEIDYFKLYDDACVDIIRHSLEEASKYTTMPGEHHIYITLMTEYPGIKMSVEILEDFPETLTIILQHQYDNLQIHENSFEVTLYFSGSPEKLVIPLRSIIRFEDPSVKFLLNLDKDAREKEILEYRKQSLKKDDIKKRKVINLDDLLG